MPRYTKKQAIEFAQIDADKELEPMFVYRDKDSWDYQSCKQYAKDFKGDIQPGVIVCPNMTKAIRTRK